MTDETRDDDVPQEDVTEETPAGTTSTATEAPPPDSEEAGIVVDPVAFDEILVDEEASRRPRGEGNLDLVLDVDVPVSVVLGNVRKSIGEIISLAEGQVIDLERTAGEPVDLLVNGKLVARGEVVVVDDHYGLRIAQIVAPQDRV
ncbi:MAG: flagellar motor switch protein FliN [Planctomycetes bacterium]|nr:flagellar motor switch protein FliN [Planctomycetota bacterium]